MQKQDIEKQFEQQIIAHKALLYKICRIYAATEVDRDDLFQDMVIQLWKAYPRFKGQSQFSTWMYRVALNTAITGFRKRKGIITPYESMAAFENLGQDNSAHMQEEQLQQLYTAIEQLNDIEKALVMLYMEDRSYKEMEDILGISESTLRVKMNRTKEKLRQLTKND